MTNRRIKFRGISLTEVLVVMTVAVILLAISIPAAKNLAKSLEHSVGARNMINAALTNARAIAIREQKYAGVRFQQASDGRHYIIFIVHDPKATGLANGFRAVTGRKPMMLPETAGVMDGKRVDRKYLKSGAIESVVDNVLDDSKLADIAANMENGKNRYMLDTCTFSIVFNPSGKICTHLVRVCNKDGITDTPGNAASISLDTVFNKKEAVDSGDAMFYQDDYAGNPVIQSEPDYGIGDENSRNSFIIFNRKEFEGITATARWSKYFYNLAADYINPYTGELVKKY